eukprot:TRINITY_DN21799_c0_g1_i2.p1 TRINITY_DN21799_c0_g1~~TRINITY_DN21799_c0_g1_i2.p1  ORF type:complete len:448 (-),score=82.12 TRINITY_DN21799_c0_g1_i2:111-1415(-)
MVSVGFWDAVRRHDSSDESCGGSGSRSVGLERFFFRRSSTSHSPEEASQNPLPPTRGVASSGDEAQDAFGCVGVPFSAAPLETAQPSLLPLSAGLDRTSPKAPLVGSPTASAPLVAANSQTQAQGTLRRRRSQSARADSTDGPAEICMPIKREWFDKIACGDKRVEFREASQFWRRRLLERQGLRRIRLLNGRATNSPFLVCALDRAEVMDISCIPDGLAPSRGTAAHRELFGDLETVICLFLGPLLELNDPKNGRFWKAESSDVPGQLESEHRDGKDNCAVQIGRVDASRALTRCGSPITVDDSAFAAASSSDASFRFRRLRRCDVPSNSTCVGMLATAVVPTRSGETTSSGGFCGGTVRRTGSSTASGRRRLCSTRAAGRNGKRRRIGMQDNCSTTIATQRVEPTWGGGRRILVIGIDEALGGTLNVGVRLA